ncbi:hypothetical protein [Streptomyces sp. NPDC048361]|uniref:hypothetical protein n=1 Tax=Streptomyces sp. NPDC048361 TaxID=3154720 RepID=UPI003426B1B4
MNAPRSTAAAAKSGPGPLRRAAVLLALVLGTALVAGPVTAEAAPRTTLASATAQQTVSVRESGQAAQAAARAGQHTVAAKSDVLASKKSKKPKKKKSGFFKKAGIVLLVLVILFIALAIFVIWFIVSRLRRRRDRH